MSNNNTSNIFNFYNFSFWYNNKPCILTNYRETSSENRVQKVPKRKSLKTKNVKNVIIYHM